MDWANVISGVIAALAVTIGLPLALRKRKKESSQKKEQLLHHFQEIGLEASLAESAVAEQRVGVRRSSGERSEGVIKIKGRNFDYVNVISVASQYGVRYFLDYLVRSPSFLGKKRKKTKLVRKKSSGVWGRVVDIEWRGDDYLCRELNWDYQLKDKLMAAGVDELKGGITISPEPKYEYVRIRISYLLPSSDSLEVIDIVASHIKKSGW
mgnify:CR=1 FL=1